MKLLITALVFLFSHLTGGAVHAYKAPANGRAYLAVASQDHTSRFKISVAPRILHVEKVYNLNQETPDFLLLEEEDDESIIKTHIRKYYAFFSDVFFPVHYQSSADSMGIALYLSCTDNSCKYIVQRVLRI